jgi:putative serine protease PepD
MAVAMLAAGLVLGSLGGGIVAAQLVGHQAPATTAQSRTASSTSTAPTAATATGGSTANALSPSAVYRQASPGVVTISTEVTSFRGTLGEATGSGVVVDKQGDILTNAHVVAGAQQITITFSDGQTARGQVAGVDNSRDLAVVKVSVSQDRLHPVTLGDSSRVQVGDEALAIGSPFGLAGTLTEGIISGLNRTSTAQNGRGLTGLIQTDAAINPGNSGGALLNSQGALIGINESIQSPVEGNVGVGFAVPINSAKQLLPSLEQGT